MTLSRAMGRSMKFQKWAAPATLGYGGVADPEYQ